MVRLMDTYTYHDWLLRKPVARGGNGVVVLPCGAGKTVVGMGVMNLVGEKTLILTTNTVAVRQWREEFLDKTALTYRIFGDFWAVRTILVRRDAVPDLAEGEFYGFRYGG